jgi:hypothetical protein
MLEYFLCILCGCLVKLADDIADDPRLSRHSIYGYIAGVSYGLVGAILFSFSRVLATCVLAVIAAVTLGGKEDHPIHYTGMLALVLAAIALGIRQPYALPLFALVIAGYADELVSGGVLLGKIRDRALHKILSYRIILDATAIAISFFLSEPAYALAIIGFDAGYQAMGFLDGKFSHSGRK